MKKWWLTCAMFSMLAVTCTGCQKADSEGAPAVIIEQGQEEAAYSLAVAVTDDVVKTQKIRCTYRQVNDQEVSFQVSGKKISKVYVQKDDDVVKGQLLAELSTGRKADEIEEQEYKIARNELLLEQAAENENLEINSKWVWFLYQSNRGEENEEKLQNDIAEIQRNYRYKQEDYQDALDVAQLKLEKLREEEDSSRVYAQIDGTISYISGDLEGSTSVKDEVIMKVIDNSQCLFESDDVEFESYLRKMPEVNLSITGGKAKGEYVLEPYDMEHWENIMYFTILQAPETPLEVGISGDVSFVYDSRQQVLTIPLDAVHMADEKPYVYVLGENDVREVKWIETGLFGDDNVEVTGGLTEGEKVIVK